MKSVSVQICAFHESIISACSQQQHKWPDLRAALSEALGSLDFEVPSCIEKAKLLVDRVTISFELWPAIPRKDLVKAWCQAVRELGEIVGIQAEDQSERAAERHGARKLVAQLINRGSPDLAELIRSIDSELFMEVANAKTN